MRFVEADVYSALDVLDAGVFDLVYTGVGALCWLPDISRWAKVVAELLLPAAGRELHPPGHPRLTRRGPQKSSTSRRTGRCRPLSPGWHH